MANLIPDSIRKLLSKYSFEFDADSRNEDLTCTICGKLMRDAYQTHCDCKYCRECIVRYLNDGNTRCRGGKDECQEEDLVVGRNVFPSAALNRKILRVRVLCPNQSCEFSSTITEMEDHLRLCSQHLTVCPYTSIGCGIGRGSRDTVETHLHREALEHTEMLMEVINNLRNEVGGLKEDCQINKTEVEAWGDQARLKEKEILERFEEEMKSRQGEREAFVELMEEQMREICGRVEGEKTLRQVERKEFVELMREQKVEITETKKKIESVEDAAKKNDASSNMAEAKDVKILRGEVEAEKLEFMKMRAEMEIMKKDVKKIKKSNVWLETENLEMKKKIIEGVEGTAIAVRDDRRRIDDLSRIINGLNIGKDRAGAVGELWFTVTRITERMKTGERFDSHHFFSHTNGYTLSVRVHPGGFGYEWLCVSSSVCRGEYDDVLSWPCRFNVSVAIVNKHTKQVYRTRIIRYNNITDNRYSNKPIDTDNPPYGWFSSFVSHSDIHSSGIIVDESLLVHVLVAL